MELEPLQQENSPSKVLMYYLPETEFSEQEMASAKNKGRGGMALYAAMKQSYGGTVAKEMVVTALVEFD